MSISIADLLSNSSTAIPGVGNTVSATQTNSLNQQDFLTLMAAQVKNQDPLDPDASGAGNFLSQMAQFSTNSSINSMQASIQQLVSSLQSNQVLQASSLVGRKVTVNSNNITLGATGEANASVNMVAGYSNVTASILSPNGQLIKTIPLGTPAAGPSPFSWDGTDNNNQPVAPGTYQIQVNASSQNQAVSLQTMVQANVDSVSIGQHGTGFTLNVAGVGAVSLSDVQQIST
jgi:flagellar basal-body rod modification protein FlgD